jgi:hypothetical protein
MAGLLARGSPPPFLAFPVSQWPTAEMGSPPTVAGTAAASTPIPASHRVPFSSPNGEPSTPPLYRPADAQATGPDLHAGARVTLSEARIRIFRKCRRRPPRPRSLAQGRRTETSIRSSSCHNRGIVLRDFRAWPLQWPKGACPHAPSGAAPWRVGACGRDGRHIKRLAVCHTTSPWSMTTGTF